jgi:hypothetical protein
MVHQRNTGFGDPRRGAAVSEMLSGGIAAGHRRAEGRLGECGWSLVRFVVDDVRRHPADLVLTLSNRLDAGRLAG